MPSPLLFVSEQMHTYSSAGDGAQIRQHLRMDEWLFHTQVLPYLRAVAGAGVSVHLLTYEKKGRWHDGEPKRRRELKRQLASQGIHWHALKYHKRPSLLATAYDV